MGGINNWLPTFNVGERHEIDVALPPEEALRQALAAPIGAFEVGKQESDVARIGWLSRADQHQRLVGAPRPERLVDVERLAQQ